MRELLAVIVGGLVGTGLRLGVDALLRSDAAFPASTLVINLIGAFVLGLLVARVWPRATPWLRAGLGAGLLGSFTTFSAVAVSLVSLVSADDWGTAIVYLVATVVGGLATAALGLNLGGRPAARVRAGNE